MSQLMPSRLKRRHDSTMNTMAISVSLPEAQVETAKQAVIEGRAESLSAYISDALSLAEQRDQLSRLLDDMKQELAP